MKCSLGISNFLEKISSLSHSVVFFYFFALIAEEGFLISSCYSLELCVQMLISFLFSLAFCFCSFLISSNPKESQPGKTDADAEAPVLWPPDVKSWLIWKDPDAGKDWGQEDKGVRGWDAWMASLTRWTWVWASSGRYWRTGEAGVLQPMGSQRVRQYLAIKQHIMYCAWISAYKFAEQQTQSSWICVDTIRSLLVSHELRLTPIQEVFWGASFIPRCFWRPSCGNSIKSSQR